MAYRQPTFAPSRPSIPQAFADRRVDSPPQAEHPTVRESQEWVLFPSRQTASSVGDTRSSYTEKTVHTAGLSKASDLVSLGSGLKSGRLSEEALDEHELDSLDDNLQAFRESSHPRTYLDQYEQNDNSLLPAHDGLGTFPSSQVQDRIWQHETFNPDRRTEEHHRRRSSVQRRLDTIEEGETYALDEEKRCRIEQWRIDQSRVLLDEIERETRRRARRESHKIPTDSVLGTTPTQNDIHGVRDLHDRGAEPESLWERLTKHFIREVIGLDDSLLSVIFGEALPEDLLQQEPRHPSTSSQERPDTSQSNRTSLETEAYDRLLQRMARELDIAVNQSPPHHEAYGIHQSPSLNRTHNGSWTTQAEPIVDTKRPEPMSDLVAPHPTDAVHQESWGVDDGDRHFSKPHFTELQTRQGEKSYWERAIDINMIFEFLRKRFSPPSPSQSTHNPPAISIQDPARRAAVIRQHHPLVARAYQRSMMRSRREASLHLIRRSASSCASQSIRSSRRGSLNRSASSGRHYWDIGGSMGSSSAIASGGLMGAWGEV